VCYGVKRNNEQFKGTHANCLSVYNLINAAYIYIIYIYIYIFIPKLRLLLCRMFINKTFLEAILSLQVC
jgi:hypothetical protein